MGTLQQYPVMVNFSKCFAETKHLASTLGKTTKLERHLTLNTALQNYDSCHLITVSITVRRMWMLVSDYNNIIACE